MGLQDGYHGRRTGGDLYGYSVDYEQGSIDWDVLLPSGVGDAVKVAGAIINGIAAA
jgi:hypothetical protein